MKYYKSFNENLQGKNNYQYEIDGIYEVTHNDTWEWLYYSQYASSTLIHHSDAKRIRICFVEPLGKIAKFKTYLNYYNKGFEYSTTKIKIISELSEDEILNTLVEEKLNFQYIIKFLNPSFSYLLGNKNKIRGDFICSRIAKRNDLTQEEKRKLLPVSKYNYYKKYRWHNL
jgi:asparagine N-glycosylation enzyme membrane subunit Stt3